MSISIAHPERYDRFYWFSWPQIDEGIDGAPKGEWECVGLDDEDIAPFLFGHLKPEFRSRFARIHVRFDGPPCAKSPLLIGVEDYYGKSVDVGRWFEDGADWLLELYAQVRP